MFKYQAVKIRIQAFRKLKIKTLVCWFLPAPQLKKNEQNQHAMYYQRQLIFNLRTRMLILCSMSTQSFSVFSPQLVQFNSHWCYLEFQADEREQS